MVTRHPCYLGSCSAGRTALAPALIACPSTSGRSAHIGQHAAPTSYPLAKSKEHCSSVTALAATRRTSSVSSSLVAVLKDELKYERESYRREEGLEELPGGFVVQDEPGTSAFLLLKQHGSEQIIVRVNIDTQPGLDQEDEGEEEYEEDEEEPPVEFVVTIGKEDTDDLLIFECESDGEYMVVNSVNLETMDEDRELGAPPYRGPLFEDLDDTLQQAFVDYLEERGINAYLGLYIQKYLTDKSALEYQKWLGRVRDFIGK